ncbi:MAG: hypothetical protein ABIP95_03100 [Pelobium sp.]
MSNINQAETEKFLTYHSNPKALVAKDLEQLKEWMGKYPYCQSLIYLATHTSQNTADYQNYLAKASTFSPDRTILFDFIHQPENFDSEMVALDAINQEIEIEELKSDIPFGFDLNEIYGSEPKDAKAKEELKEEPANEEIEATENLQTENIENETVEDPHILKGDNDISEEVKENASVIEENIVEDKSDFAGDDHENIEATENQLAENEEIQQHEISENEIVEEKSEPIEQQNSNFFGLDLNEIIGFENRTEDPKVENLYDESSKVNSKEEEIKHVPFNTEETDSIKNENIAEEFDDADEIQEYEAQEIDAKEKKTFNDENEESITENIEVEEHSEEIDEENKSSAVAKTEEIKEIEIDEETKQPEEEQTESTVEEIEEQEVATEQETTVENEESEISEEPIEVEQAQEKELELTDFDEKSEAEIPAEKITNENDTPEKQLEEAQVIENIEEIPEDVTTEETSEEEEEPIVAKETPSDPIAEVPETITNPQVKEGFAFETPVQPNFFSFQKREDKDAIAEDAVVQKTDSGISQYNDDSMPYTFLWWLNKTRKEHASTHQPYASIKLDPSKKTDQPQLKKDNLDQQIAENIFHLRGVEGFSGSSTQGNQTVPFEFLKKEHQIIEKFITEEPQIRPPAPNKIDTENKAKKSSEDSNEVVSETLAKIYVEQMLYHKALDVYKKLSLKFPEKSTYFASQIKYLELKVN